MAPRVGSEKDDGRMGLGIGSLTRVQQARVDFPQWTVKDVI